jgi:hypothetical protein
VRAGATSDKKVAAYKLASDGLFNVDSSLFTTPGYGARVDTAARRLLSRLYLDAESTRGDYFKKDPPADAKLTPLVIGHLRENLMNTDKVRTFPTRRAAVDILKKLQIQSAYNVLVEARNWIAFERTTLTGADQALADDLLARIDVAIRPYFIAP